MSKTTFVGSFTGAGAIANVSIGFIPSHVRLVNVTDGTVEYEWFDSMAAGTTIKRQNIVDSASTGNGSQTLLGSGGITAYAGGGTTATGAGFTVPAALATNAKVFAYIATRLAGNTAG